MMTNTSPEYKISKWLAEFKNRDTELAYQKYFQHMINRQLRIVLIFWAILLLLFALPDFDALGASRPFYYLLAYRVVIAMLLLLVVLNIKPDTDFFKISYVVAAIVIIGFTGFMLLFYFRPNIVQWIVGVIIIQIIALMMFIPIRFSLAFAGGIYAVVITLVTRWAMGSSKANLIGLFFVLMLPFVLGTATAMRLGVSQRKQFALLSQTEEINQALALEIDRRRALELKLTEMAATDPLTGLYNRREYEMLFTHEIERARRANTPLSVCIVDLDHFKKVNDSYGHGAGDEVLRRTANLLKDKLRSMDIIGRLGGEEFIILLPETTIEQAAMIGNRLLDALALTDIHTNAAIIKVTATIGITRLLENDPDFNAIIQRADEALYRGKETGRNRVETNAA